MGHMIFIIANDNIFRELNSLGMAFIEIVDIFEGLNPKNMIINRTNGEIKYDVSSLENISLAIASDR